jgi:hypothetical protein
MTYRMRTKGMLRALRNGLAQLNRLLTEAENSDEDLVFHIREREPRNLRLDRKSLPSRQLRP